MTIFHKINNAKKGSVGFVIEDSCLVRKHNPGDSSYLPSLALVCQHGLYGSSLWKSGMFLPKVVTLNLWSAFIVNVTPNDLVKKEKVHIKYQEVIGHTGCC